MGEKSEVIYRLEWLIPITKEKLGYSYAMESRSFSVWNPEDSPQ